MNKQEFIRRLSTQQARKDLKVVSPFIAAIFPLAWAAAFVDSSSGSYGNRYLIATLAGLGTAWASLVAGAVIYGLTKPTDDSARSKPIAMKSALLAVGVVALILGIGLFIASSMQLPR